jgi:uncharacterized protein YkwD
MLFPFVFTLIIACTKADALPGDSVVPETVNKVRMLQVVNEIRKKGCNCGDTYYGPAPALTWNAQLETAAYNHSKDMSEKKYFSHESTSGKGPGERIRTAGYRWKAYGENIAVGYSNEKSVVDGWLTSPGHCRNIMNKSYKEMGVARVNGLWTQDFGSK